MDGVFISSLKIFFLFFVNYPIDNRHLIIYILTINKEFDMMISGTFTSVWDDGEEVVTRAILNDETGEITADASDDVNELDILVSEHFTSDDGTTYEVCPVCHYHIIGATKCMGGCRIGVVKG